MKAFIYIVSVTCLFQVLISAQIKSSPAWSVNPSQFQFSATVTAQVKYNNQPVSSGANILAAFLGNEVRGVASASFYNSEQIYFLTVYSNSNTEQLTFKVYFAGIDTIVTIKEPLTFTPNQIFGAVTAPVLFHAYHNFDNPPNVTGIPNQIIEVGNSFTQFNLDNFLTELDGSGVTWSFQGNSQLNVSIDNAHVVTVSPPSSSWTGSEMIRFRVTDQTTQALFTEDTVLFQVRPLDHPPHLGSIPAQVSGINNIFPKIDLHNYLTESDGDSIAWSYSFDESTANDLLPPWSINPGAFSSSMTITAEVTSLGNLATGTGNVLAAFSNGAIRGVAKPVRDNGKWLFYITIFSNSSGDTISFRFYDAAAHKNIPVEQKLLFKSNSAYGNPGLPFPLYAGNILPTIDSQGMVSFKKTDPAWVGSERIVFRAQDLGSLHSYADTSGTLFSVLNDHAPIVAGIPEQVIQKGKTFSPFNLNSWLTESDGNSVVWSYSGNSHINVSVDAAKTVTLSVPDTAWVGTEHIIFRATDQTANALFTEDTVAFRVTFTDHPPHLLAVPTQVAGNSSTFNPVGLSDYLQEADKDSVAWAFTFAAPTVTDPAPQWSVNPAGFESSMTFTAEIKSLNVNRTGTAHKLAAFAGTQLRGVASPLEFNGRWIYFLTVYANGDGEQIHFQFYDASVQKKFPVKEKATFVTNAAFGSPTVPFRMNAGNIILQPGDHDSLNVTIADTSWYGSETVLISVRDENTAQHYFDTTHIVFSRLDQVVQSVNAPSMLTATPMVGPLRIRLTWNDNSANENGFLIQRKTGDSTVSGAFITIDSLPANSGTYTDATIADSTRYTYRVLAYNTLLQSGNSNQATVISFSEVPALLLTAFIEGLYNPETRKLVPDSMTVFLRHPFNLYAIVDSAKSILDSNGTGTFYFPNAKHNTGYYVILRHRNSIETWSANPVTFPTGTTVYDFSSSANKAYASNMMFKGSRWCIYSGDVDQTGFIDNNDLLFVDNDAFNFMTGFRITDINGSGFVDNIDLLIVDNNAYNYVGIQSPIAQTKKKSNPKSNIKVGE